MYKLIASARFTPVKEDKKEASDLLSRARLIDRVNPSQCTCGAGDDAVQHSANCQMMFDFEAKMRQAKSELR